jgi:hypothetical protein
MWALYLLLLLQTEASCIARKLSDYCRPMSPVHRRMNVTEQNGRAVAQAVSRWLPTAAARVRDRSACGICSG